MKTKRFLQSLNLDKGNSAPLARVRTRSMLKINHGSKPLPPTCARERAEAQQMTGKESQLANSPLS